MSSNLHEVGIKITIHLLQLMEPRIRVCIELTQIHVSHCEWQTETYMQLFQTPKTSPLTITPCLNLEAATIIFYKGGKIFVPHLQKQ